MIRIYTTLKLLTGLMGVLCVFLLVLTLYQSAQAARYGEELKKVEAKAKEINAQIQLLQKKVYLQNSLTRVQEKAADMGFTERATPQTMLPDSSIALSI